MSTGYQISREANSDLEGIYEFGIDRFGLLQANEYFDRLLRQFDMIAADPLQFPSVLVLGEHFRRSVIGSHSIYFRFDDRGILIIRILGRQDAQGALDQSD